METISDQKLKAYFLGALTAADAARLEEECASSKDLTEQAQVVETELADEYLRGTFSASERRLFEENYLTTEARRDKLRLADNLWKVANENRVPIQASAPSIWQTLFGGQRRLAFGGLLAILVGGAVLFVWLNSDQPAEIARWENGGQSPAPNAEIPMKESSVNGVNEHPNFDSTDNNLRKNGSETAAPKSNHAPVVKPAPTAKPIAPPAPPAPTLATFALLPGTLRGEGEQFIKIKAKTESLNLRLTLPKAAAKYESYRAVLQTADGEIVDTSPNLKFPNIFLPAAKLENKTYLVLLEGQNAQNPAESVAEYAFRVRRAK
ncbi:MAG: hypothetical protein M3T96_01510 [Acidobacteriota bacterium]|nr:hypothetical protein [Acidobacteriota bacterium]